MAITPYSKFYKRNSRGATPGEDDEEDKVASTMPIGKKPPMATTMPIKKKPPTATTLPVGGKKPPTATTMPIGKRPIGSTMPIGKSKDALMKARAEAIQRRLRKSRQ